MKDVLDKIDQIKGHLHGATEAQLLPHHRHNLHTMLDTFRYEANRCFGEAEEAAGAGKPDQAGDTALLASPPSARLLEARASIAKEADKPQA